MYDPNNPMPWMQTPGMELQQTLLPGMMRGQQGQPSIGQAIGQQVMPQPTPIQQVDTYRSQAQPTTMGGVQGQTPQMHNGQSPYARQAPSAAPPAPGAAPAAPASFQQGMAGLGQMTKLIQQLQQQRSAGQPKAPNADPIAQPQADTPKAPMGLLGDTPTPTSTPTAPAATPTEFDPMKLFRGLLGGGTFS